MKCLSRSGASLTDRTMVIRRSRSAMFGAVLAFLALFGLFAVSGWHNAMVHDDDPIHAVSIEHSHGSSSQTDPDAPVHVLAHATGQWIGFADPFMPVRRCLRISGCGWSTWHPGCMGSRLPNC